MQGPDLIQIGSLGKGTSGRVLRAELKVSFGEVPAGTSVAQKRPLNPAGALTLLREQEVLEQVRAPTLQASLGTFEDAEGPYLLTRFVGGPSLVELLRRGPMENEPLRRVGQDLARALQALHSAGWLHGDLAPANGRQDADEHTVLLDLGFAARIGECSLPRGTPAYLAPEEASGKPKTPASEIYSLGLILWELATGSHPLAPDGCASSVPEESLTDSVSAPPSIRNPRVAPDLDELLGRMLDENPENRPNAQEVDAWLGKPPSPHNWGEDPWAARNCLPFVGHEKEWSQLQRAWESATTGRGTLVWLEADRGLGKTRLMNEFVRSLRRGPQPPYFLSVRCPPALEGRPTHPIRTLLRRWLALSRHTPARQREQDLLIAAANPSMAAALIQTLDPASDSPAQVEVPLLSSWLLQTAAQAPLVIFMDEVERAGEATGAVLQHLIEALPNLPLMLVLGVCDAQETSKGPLGALACETGGETPHTKLRLSPLDRQNVADLIDLIFAGSVPAERLGRVILERTEGRPARIAALIQRCLTTGLMRVHHGGGLELVGPVEALPPMAGRLPDLRGQLSRMEPATRQWLECIAVHGPTARPRRLANAQGATPDEVSAVLGQLLREGWLEQGADGLVFPSATIRDGILAGIPTPRLQELHGSAADSLAQRTGSSRAFERAFHLKAAGRTQDLVRLVLKLLPRAKDLGHPTRVLVLVDWALASSTLTDQDNPQRNDPTRITAQQSLELHAAAAEAAGGLGRRAEEVQHLNALVELPFDSQSHPGQVALVYLLHGHAAADTGRAGLARGYLRNAAKLGLRGGKKDLASEAKRRLAELELSAGQAEQATELIRQARSCTRTPLLRLHAQVIKGLIALLQDRPTRGRAHAQAVQRKCRQLKDTPRQAEVRARAWILEARCDGAVGKSAAAEPKLRQALKAAEQAGLGILKAEAHARMGRVLIDLGEDQHAEQELREGQLIAQENRLGQGEVLARLFLGILLSEQNKQAGPQLVESALERASGLGLARTESLGRAIWARVLLAQGRYAEAFQAAGEALVSLGRVGAELSDRIVIVATHQLCCQAADEVPPPAELEDLEQRIARVSRAAGRGIARTQVAASLQGLRDAALSSTGPLYPRRET